MQRKTTIFRGFVFQVFFWTILAVPALTSAATVYVDEDGDNGNSGTSDQPFKTLEKAAEEVNKGDADKVKIGKGSFSGGVTFEQGVNIEGEGKGSTTITSALTFKKKAELKNLAVKTKDHNAITLGKSASGNFKDIDVRDFTGVGIWVTAGSSSLILEDSRIGGSNGKGIYAEAGAKINISGSSIVDNKQEGIDIRQNTRGTIKNNTIESNSESGIELIVGSSDFSITGNEIKKNGASGIAYQFYSLNKKSGEINTTGNSLSGNRKYGLDCSKPQGGNSSAGYWADSIALEGNSFSNNKDGDIATSCKLVEAKTEEEEKALQEKLVEEARIKAEEEAKAQAQLALTEAQTKEVEERIKQELQSTNEIVQKTENVIQDAEYTTLIEQVAHKNRIEVFFWGQEGKETQAIRAKITEDEATLRNYQAQLVVLPSYQAQSDLQLRIANQEERLEQYKKQLDHLENTKGILNSFQKEILGRINRIIYVLPL